MTNLKTRKKRDGEKIQILDHFPKSNARWAWMAGSVAGAAAVTAANAEVVQITQANNQITTGTNTLKADLTGDGVADLQGLVGGSTSGGASTYTSAPPNSYKNVLMGLNSVNVQTALKSLGSARYVKTWDKYSSPGGAQTDTYSSVFTAYVAGPPSVYANGATPQMAVGLVPVTFTDARINGGAATNGFLEIKSSSASPTSHTVQLVRLVFNDASTAAPTGVVAGGTKPAFDPTKSGRITALEAQIKKLTKQFKKCKKKIRKASPPKKKRLKKKCKKIKKKLKMAKADLTLLKI